MDYIEKESLSVPEAVASACRALGIEEKDAQVQVISAPGARRVKVRVGKAGAAMPSGDPPAPAAVAAPAASYAPAPAPAFNPGPAEPTTFQKPADYAPRATVSRKQPDAAAAQNLRAELEKMLVLMGTPSAVEVKEHAGNTILNITGEKEGLLIGKRGMTADDLQNVMNEMLHKATGDRDLFVVVDVADYRIRQERKIMDRAKELAAMVMADGVQQSMGPLSAAERRLVHMELKPLESIETFSVGNGSMKKVVIQKKA